MTTLKTAKTTQPAKSAYPMLPYQKGKIDYGSLNFDPDVADVPPDHMEQNREIREVLNALSARFTDFDTRPDVFLDNDSNVCYNPDDLNVRAAPDVYIAFGVDAEAIRPRKLYLPWEVGKPPDWALEVASQTTARQDTNRKPAIYAQIGIPEYWRFDPTGGRYHGQPLYGGQLAGITYDPIPLTTEPDGLLKGYSQILQLSLTWHEGWPRFYDPAAGAYLENWQQVWTDRQAARQAIEAERAARQSTQAALHNERQARAADQQRIRQLEAELRRLR